MTKQEIETLAETALRSAKLLGDVQAKLVFAESCTAGLLAATISQIPGISQHFCGSFVTYRESLKTDLLGVETSLLAEYSAVSRETTLAMVRGALDRSSEATIALAITGHFGPGAPTELDGVVFIACQTRQMTASIERRVALESVGRKDRQQEAAMAAFVELNLLLETMTKS